MFCIDASVILSAARGTEPHSRVSQRFLEELKGTDQKAFLPEIIIPEIASGLMRATKDASFMGAFVAALRDIPHFSFVPIDATMASAAVRVIAETSLRDADALYVALAWEYGLTLVTLDREQLTRAKRIIDAREP